MRDASRCPFVLQFNWAVPLSVQPQIDLELVDRQPGVCVQYTHTHTHTHTLSLSLSLSLSHTHTHTTYQTLVLCSRRNMKFNLHGCLPVTGEHKWCLMSRFKILI